MLKILIGTDWVENRNRILLELADDVVNRKKGRVLLVPELISHDMERRMCNAAGNTASQFAEVLSFTRLARRVADETGHCVMPCLDEGGRVVAMAAAVNQVQSKLKYFASVGTKPEFITGLVETIDECKRCLVEPSSLLQASKSTSGSLAQKLEELFYIFEAYDGICAHGKKDPRDLLSWLLDELESSDYAQSHVFYIDGFYDFTHQQFDILTYLIRNSKEVTVSLCCDQPGSKLLTFERPGETATTLVRIARSHGVPVEMISCESRNAEISQIANNLFEGDKEVAAISCLSVSSYDSVFLECEAVAERIRELVRTGCRYRDISVVCPNLAEYEGPLNMVFRRCGIPVYLSGVQNVLDRPIIATVLTALDVVLSGFERTNVLAYLKTALSPVTLEECDLIENYALLWNVSGKRWTQQWTMNPRGIVQEWTTDDEKFLNRLNGIREKIVSPFLALNDAFQSNPNASEWTTALFKFLEKISVAKRLADLSDKLQHTGDLQNAQVLNQLWEILINALEQMHDILRNSILEPEVFSKLFRILLSRYDVGTIPSVLDSVTIGVVSAMRCQETKHLFVLGAVEGDLPGYGVCGGVFTDQDRGALRDLGLSLNGGSVESLQNTFSDIYCVFRGATDSVTVSYPGGQPSYVYLRLKSISKQSNETQQVLGAVTSNRKVAAAYLLRADDYDSAKQLNLENEYGWIRDKRSYHHGNVSKQNIRRLYGTQFKLSASQVDVHANCAMSYFLKYGLGAKERKPAQVDPAEFGSFVHDVLENTARKIMELGGFKVVRKDEALRIAASNASNYLHKHFSDLESNRLNYLLQRNEKELALIVEELWNELHNSEFVPAMFEAGFGVNGSDFPAIQIHGSDVEAKLRGFVDRVDIWNNNGSAYYRVVDYKTGIKTFDYCDVINGIGLQLFIYLFALAESGLESLGDRPLPAGMQYFPARVPIVSVDNALDENAVIKEREQCWKRHGLLLNDDVVLAAMESENLPGRTPYRRKKDGTLVGDLANMKQFELLKDFVFGYLQSMVDDIASGNVTANPYTRDARKNACRFCPFGMVCHKSDVEGRRIFKAINAQQFWDEISREVSGNG